MNHKNLDELRRLSVPQLTELYLDRLFGSNKVLAFNADAVEFSDLKVSDINRAAVLSEAEESAKAYAESRNNGTQPRSFVNATREEHNLMESVKANYHHRKSHLRGKK